MRHDYARILTWAALGAVILLALLPAWAQLSGGAAAWRRVCDGNLKALYQAARAYGADHDDYFPFGVNRRPAPQVWLWWYDFLAPYTPDAHVYCCPASKKAQEYDVYAPPEPLLPALAFSPYWVSYGLNYWLARDNDPGAPYKPSTLKDLANTPLFADAAGQLLSSNKGGWNVDPRHDGWVNVVLTNGALVMTKPEYDAKGDYVLRRSNGQALHWMPGE